ncbi:hypothetical protein CKM354_000898600 [Cercospora kikuchii]|uniref:Heterokaryon incompatibility domain-containing protein n=1 Tax=Cercospora kikuchii TaxID=84275 RepID=A0A9P3CU89_9PEZI|nr:uncharacterized protein CKM354_000898600 [Cercospora kikuchii]GIZ45835.1 hypothetical protein CKM354_000898600 [Cercospora kikuchii]
MTFTSSACGDFDADDCAALIMTSPQDMLSNADVDSLERASTSSPWLQNNSSEVNSGSPAPVAAYSPVPLEDPKTQIRLLRFVSAVGHSPLALETSVWSLDEAPPYVAISYTWGGLNTRTVVINGEPVRIRYNAYYALRQVQLHHRQIHIWIDSICINQSDDAGKSAQVAMMYRIFNGATQVVSSLGAHSGNIEWLFTVVRFLKPILERLPTSRYQEWELRQALCEELFEGSLRDDFRTAIRDLDQNPYWQRLWVVQEVAAAHNDIGLLSGPHHIGAIAMKSFQTVAIPEMFGHFHQRRFRRRDRATMALLAIMGKFRDDSRSLETNLSQFGEFHCSDPRDRLFALVEFTDCLCACIEDSDVRDLDLHLPPQAVDFIGRNDESPHQIAQPVVGVFGNVAALVCPGAQPDDILVPVEGSKGLLLIVRGSKTKNVHYDIIGQGLLIEHHIIMARPLCRPGWCRCSPALLARQPIFVADVHVALTVEELIVLRAQQNPIMKEKACIKKSSIAAGLARMATSPSTRPRSTVSLTNIACKWWH